MTDLEMLREMETEIRADLRAWRESDSPNAAAIVAARRQLLEVRGQIRALEEAERPVFTETDYPMIAERIRRLLAHPEIMELVNGRD